jgi:hypothetical protein
MRLFWAMLARPIFGIFEHFAQRGFEFILLPSRVYARPHAGNANRWAFESYPNSMI